MLAQWSQVTAGERSDGSSDKIPFDIPRQRADLALIEFAAQADVTFIFPFEEARREIANRLVGRHARGEAIRILLAGTGLEPAFDEQGTLAVHISDTSTRKGNAMYGTTNRSGERTLASVVAAILAVFTGQRASGQEAQGGESADRAAATRIEEVVVTAQKRSERLQDVPISVSVLGGADLDQSSVEGITQALNRVPGVSTVVAYQGGSTQLVVRGVTASGPLFNGSSPIGYYLDSAPFALVKTAVVPDSSAYDLERVEVLRGPQGTLYGASALNGVMRVLTKDADLDAFDFKVRTSLSSSEKGGESYRGDLALNVPLVEGKLAARAVAGYQDLAGWIDRPGNRDANDAQIRNLRLKINAQPVEALSIVASAWSNDADYGAMSVSGPDGRRQSFIEEPQSTEYEVYSLKATYEFAPFSVSSMTSYLDYHNTSDLDLRPQNIDATLFTIYDSTMFSQEVVLNSTHDGAWRWSVGGIYRDAEDVLFQDVGGPAILDRTDISESFAVFGELTRIFLDGRFELTGGLRYFEDDVKARERDPFPTFRADSTFDAVSPRLVLTWHPSGDLTVYGSYAEGFRSGFDQYAFAVVGAEDFPPADADTLTNYELGLKGSAWERRLSYEAAVYFIDWQDVQQTLTVPYGSQRVPTTAVVNGDSASGIGFDFALTVRPVDGLTLGVNFSWNDLGLDSDVFSGGELLFAKGDRLNFSPELIAGASVDYVFQLGRADLQGRFSASANYASEQDWRNIIDGDQVIAPGDAMLIARTSFSVDSANHWSATLFVDNVNDESGFPYRSPYGGFSDSRIRPRTLGLQLEYHW